MGIRGRLSKCHSGRESFLQKTPDPFVRCSAHRGLGAISAKHGAVGYKRRRDKQAREMPLDQIVSALRETIEMP